MKRNMGGKCGALLALPVWLRGAARGENSDLDFSFKLVAGGESLEGLAVIVTVVLARGQHIDVLTG